MRKLTATILTAFIAFSAVAQQLPKREFRGAWLHIVGNQTIKNMTTDQVKIWITSTLDTLQSINCNAVVFQVRPQADAFYSSELEPWTRFLTGVQGQAPNPYWDPLQFAIEECHKRGMELHAWLNPYRVTSDDKEVLCPEHLYFKKPGLFVKYGKQLYFDPGIPEAREHTVKVIQDIVRRYDVDAIHFDDYFYPYPIDGKDFPDDASFKQYSNGFTDKGDWRRNNVTQLIKEINVAIKEIKPWIRFGISPFGIHRNKKQDPEGSNTNGLSTYDQLYADIPLWCKEGYIDYNVPQLYWKIGHKLADYETLIKWWNDGNFGAHFYVGQSIATFKEPDVNNPSEDQTEAKIKLVRELPHVDGNIWWPGWYFSNGAHGGTTLAKKLRDNYQKERALIPAYTRIDAIAPDPVQKIYSKGRSIYWEAAKTSDPLQEPGFFVVYRFLKDEKVDFDNPERIFRITKETSIEVPACKSKRTHKYYVTVTDHCWNESIPSAPVEL